LHGGDALRRREAGEGIHYEGRKAKKTPPISPQPSVETRVKAKSNLSTIFGFRSSHSFSEFAY
jgi:hypothetical protein